MMKEVAVQGCIAPGSPGTDRIPRNLKIQGWIFSSYRSFMRLTSTESLTPSTDI